MIAVLSFGCKKENNVQPKNEVPAADKAVTQKIVNFKTHLMSYKDTPNAKDGAVMPIDSAVWYSEALLNYSYCNAAAGLNNFTTVSDTIEMPIVNGQVAYSALYATYAQMETLIAAQQNRLQNPNTNLVLTDVASLGENGGNTSLVVTSGFSDDDVLPTTGFEYHYAASVIASHVNRYIAVPAEGFYYTGITTINIFKPFGYSVSTELFHPYHDYDLTNYNDPTPQGDNMYDYRLFYCFFAWWMPNQHYILSNAEINYYVSKVGGINQDMFAMVPEINGKNFIGMSAQGETGLSQPEYDIFHVYDLRYANIVLTGGGGTIR